jgi:hypothetical protein
VVQVSLPRRRSWAGIAWLLASAAGVLIALALGYTLVLWVMLAATALAARLFLREVAPDSQAAQPAPTGASQAAHAQRGVWTADGIARQALIVPAETVEGYQTVLTLDGYALVNAEGRVVYALNREAQAASSEPIVVTVVDEEARAY